MAYLLSLYVQQATNLLYRFVYFIQVVHHIDVYDMFCLLIERLALLQLLADEYLYFLRSLVEQQGAYALAHLEVSIEGFWRCLR